MVLRVSQERFADEVKSRLPGMPVYLAPKGRHTMASAGAVETSFVIQAEFQSGPDQARAAIEREELEVHFGEWSDTMEEPGLDDLPAFLVAVAYRSEEATPGLWLDASKVEPTPSESLKKMYEEFRTNGEIKEVSFDQFVKVIQPNVLIVPPHQWQAWAEED